LDESCVRSERFYGSLIVRDSSFITEFIRSLTIA
jgi:hypothetical protein